MADNAATRALIVGLIAMGLTAARDASADCFPACPADVACGPPCSADAGPFCVQQCLPHLSQACDTFVAGHPSTWANPQKCSQTEVALYARDTSGQCLLCALNKGVVDDTVGDVGQECDDFSGAGVTQCLTTLQCELGVQNENNPPSVSPIAQTPVYDYCGSSSSCPGTGPCAAQISAGFPGLTSPQIQASLFVTSQPSGRADVLMNELSRNCFSFCASLGPYLDVPYPTAVPGVGAPALPTSRVPWLAAALLAAFGLSESMRRRTLRGGGDSTG